jgi:tagatose 1,6-diphosphate aldolase GatY/KbaY
MACVVFQVDMLAVTVGNVHGEYKNPPVLDFERLRKIGSNLRSAGFDTPLVLHGASGLPVELIQKSMELGVCKFNVNTDLRGAAMQEMRKLFDNKGKVCVRIATPFYFSLLFACLQTDLVDVMKATTNAMHRVAVDKIKLFSL